MPPLHFKRGLFRRFRRWHISSDGELNYRPEMMLGVMAQAQARGRQRQCRSPRADARRRCSAAPPLPASRPPRARFAPPPSRAQTSRCRRRSASCSMAAGASSSCASFSWRGRRCTVPRGARRNTGLPQCRAGATQLSPPLPQPRPARLLARRSGVVAVTRGCWLQQGRGCCFGRGAVGQRDGPSLCQGRHASGAAAGTVHRRRGHG